MTTRKFLIALLAAAGAVLAAGSWLAGTRENMELGAALIVASLGIALWAGGAYRRQMWAWHVAHTLTSLFFLAGAVAIVALAAALVQHYSVGGRTLLILAGATFALLAACMYGYWLALRYLRRERYQFEATLSLERALGTR